jgi:hypothetical protein
MVIQVELGRWRCSPLGESLHLSSGRGIHVNLPSRSTLVANLYSVSLVRGIIHGRYSITMEMLAPPNGRTLNASSKRIVYVSPEASHAIPSLIKRTVDFPRQSLGSRGGPITISHNPIIGSTLVRGITLALVILKGTGNGTEGSNDAGGSTVTWGQKVATAEANPIIATIEPINFRGRVHHFFGASCGCGWAFGGFGGLRPRDSGIYVTVPKFSYF